MRLYQNKDSRSRDRNRDSRRKVRFLRKVRFSWKATKTADSTQMSNFDLVFHRVRREGQLGIYLNFWQCLVANEKRMKSVRFSRNERPLARNCNPVFYYFSCSFTWLVMGNVHFGWNSTSRGNHHRRFDPPSRIIKRKQYENYNRSDRTFIQDKRYIHFVMTRTTSS